MREDTVYHDKKQNLKKLNSTQKYTLTKRKQLANKNKLKNNINNLH